MLLPALVIGYGSIGKRHVDILNSMDTISSVAVLSNQSHLPFETITSLEEILNLNPNYIVVASSTTLHHEQLVFLEKNLQGKKILVEKPLFDFFDDFRTKNNQVFVGYNLRFHPIMKLIKEKIAEINLWSIQVFCGSYLPDWRPGRDYRETSSAKQGTGGGVLLDLSHELDYVQWLTGPIAVKYVVNEKVSDLEIETDDLLLLSGQTEDGAHLQVCLNYFTRKPMRQVLIDGEDISIRADLVENTLSVVERNETYNYSWPESERNETYRAQHKAILEDDLSYLCTYGEGLEIMRLIDSIRSFNN
jgi:predicted dehydrogenase